MGLVLLVGPAEEPVTLEAVKLHLRVDGEGEDALIQSLIAASRQQAEAMTGRVLVTQKWRYTSDQFPAAAIALPNPPLVSVERIGYLDSEGNDQEIPPAGYRVHTSALIGMVSPGVNQRWPATFPDPEAITVDFTAGYGPADKVPPAIKQWMLLSIGTWYACRESLGVNMTDLPREHWDGLLDPYRIWRVA